MQLLQDLSLLAGPQTLRCSPHSCNAAARGVCAGWTLVPPPLIVAAAAAAVAVHCCESLSSQARIWMVVMMFSWSLSAAMKGPERKVSFRQLAVVSLAQAWLCGAEGFFQLPQGEGGHGVGAPEGVHGMPDGQGAAGEARFGKEAAAGLGRADSCF